MKFLAPNRMLVEFEFPNTLLSVLLDAGLVSKNDDTYCFSEDVEETLQTNSTEDKVFRLLKTVVVEKQLEILYEKLTSDWNACVIAIVEILSVLVKLDLSEKIKLARELSCL